MRVFPLIAAAALAMPLAAQTNTFVSPAKYKNEPAYTASYYPIGYRNTTYNGAAKLLQVHDDVPVMLVGSLAFRRGSSSAYFYTMPAYTVDVEITMSSAATTAKTISRTYASNHGANKVTVLKRKKVNLPAAPHLPIAPQIPMYVFKFDTKFLHTAQKSLCWEMTCYSNDLASKGNAYNYLDRAYQPTRSTSSQYGFAQYYGWGCRGSWSYYNQAYMYMNAYKRGTSVNMYMYTYYLSPGNTNAAFLVGTKRQNLDLTSLGANGCLLSVVPSITIPYKTDYRGYGRFPSTGNLVLPWSPSMEGVALYGQSVGLDKNANSLGLVTSRAYERRLPIIYANGLPAGQTYRAGNGATTNPIGYGPYSYYATVTQFGQ